ncbi:MAG TPA: adenylate/guanylate cyclase domain-containing protein [Acidimicrobiales bacterium]|nr:adenylate/guanylate cyclase domain-containing protein [Acidimicrobiales bacterium]
MADAEMDALRRWLAEQGASPDQLDLSDERRLLGLASDLVLANGATFSAADLSARCGLPLDVVVTSFRRFGVEVADPEECRFTEGDAKLLEGLHAGNVVGATGPDLPRVVAAAMARIAEAAVALYVQGPQDEMDREGTPLVVRAERNAWATARGLDLGAGLGVLFRHHMAQALAWQRLTQLKERRQLARLCIGFVDLVGSTGIQAGLDPPALAHMVSRFESLAFDVVAASGGRLVKYIGDEIMVAALDAQAGCHIVSQLVATFAADGLQPRGGLVYGEVLFRHGDFYGPVVNLAARLVDEAIPGEVLVDASVVEAARDAPATFAPAGRRVLKGFAEPIPAWSLEPRGTPAPDPSAAGPDRSGAWRT